MIRFDSVTKDYDGTTAVNGLDLSVEATLADEVEALLSEG
jgi:ABC-type multidrug transport system ATPase subunit